MKSIWDLKKASQDGLSWVKAQPEVKEAEVFVASNEHLLTRLNYTSAIPCNGMEEPKSISSFGMGIRVAFRTGQGLKYGFGSAAGMLAQEGIEQAFSKAQQGAVLDPEFVSLPRPSAGQAEYQRFHDPALMKLGDEELVQSGWMELNGALEVFSGSKELVAEAGGLDKISDLGIIVGGDVTVLRQRIAVASTNLPDVRTDESTSLFSSVTAMVERNFGKGSGWSAHSHWKDFNGRSGAEAAHNAIRSMNGQRVPDGEYSVIFGPQPVADIFHNLILPALHADTFFTSASPFQGKVGQQIAWEKLSVYDHGALPRFAASKGITCEGLPTGRTDLIRDGSLVGLLSNYYESQRLLRDPKARQKLGIDPNERPECLIPRNGFRFMDGVGRSFQVRPYISATNVLIESKEKGISQPELLRRVGNGLYIGRIWYTYPINGLAAGDFTCTVVGDSYIIRDGKLSTPLKPNTVRINDNIHRLLNSLLGIGGAARGTNIWAASEVIYAPEMAVSGVPVKAIAEFMEGGA